MKKAFILLALLLLPLASALSLEATVSENSISVNASGAVDLYGAQFNIAFNPEIIQVLEVSKGGFLEKDASQAFFFEGQKANGIIENIIYLRLSSNFGVSGNGSLAAIKFSRLKPGDPGIKIENIILTNSKNEKLESTIIEKKPEEPIQPAIIAAIAAAAIILIAGAHFFTRARKKAKK